jgi:hypothetical protein
MDIIRHNNLNTHQSATLVAWVAQQCGLPTALGVKGQRGILKSVQLLSWRFRKILRKMISYLIAVE